MPVLSHLYTVEYGRPAPMASSTLRGGMDAAGLACERTTPRAVPPPPMHPVLNDPPVADSPTSTQPDAPATPDDAPLRAPGLPPGFTRRPTAARPAPASPASPPPRPSPSPSPTTSPPASRYLCPFRCRHGGKRAPMKRSHLIKHCNEYHTSSTDPSKPYLSVQLGFCPECGYYEQADHHECLVDRRQPAGSPAPSEEHPADDARDDETMAYDEDRLMGNLWRLDAVSMHQACLSYEGRYRRPPDNRALKRQMREASKSVLRYTTQATQVDRDTTERLFKLQQLLPAILLERRSNKELRAFLETARTDPATWIEAAIKVTTEEQEPKEHAPPSQHQQVQARQRVVREQLRVGEVAKAYAAATSTEKLANPTAQIIEEEVIPKLNLPPDREPEPMPEVPEEITRSYMRRVNAIKAQDVRRALARLKCATNPGVTNYTAEFLVMLASDDEGMELIMSLAKTFLKFELPDAIRPFFVGGQLKLIEKSTGGHRPIVPQGTWMKLCERILLHLICKENPGTYAAMEGLFAPHQFAVGTQAGNDVVVHGVNALLLKNPEHVGVKLDIANAYSSVNRSALVAKLMEKPTLAWLAPWVVACYGQTLLISVRLRDKWGLVRSDTGILQGAVLSPFLYATLTIDTLRAAQEAYPRVTVLSILDDLFVVGPLADTEAACNMILRQLREFDQVSGDKGAAIYGHVLQGGMPRPPRGDTINLDGVPPIPVQDGPDAGMLVLGVPVGSRAYVEQTLADKEAKLTAELLALATNVDHLQSRFKLLQLVVPSKLTHLARLTFCTDSDLVTGFLERADGMCYDMLRDMAGNYPPAAGPQLDIPAYLAQQPRATGGLGLCHQAQSRAGAFLGSVTQVLQRKAILPPSVQRALDPDLLDSYVFSLPFYVDAAVKDFHGAYSDAQLDEPAVPLPADYPALYAMAAAHGPTSPDLRRPQSFFNTLVHRARRLALQDAIDGNNATGVLVIKAKLRSMSQPGASWALDALPLNSELTMSNEEFRTTLQLYLGVRATVIPSTLMGKPCRCNNGQTLVSTYHLCVCRKSGAIMGRHTRQISIWTETLRTMGLRVTPEVRAFGDNERSGPDMLVDGLLGRPVALDVTNVHVEQSHDRQGLRAAAETDLHWAAQQERKKHARYDDILGDTRLYTLAYESTGAIGKEHKDFFGLLHTFQKDGGNYDDITDDHADAFNSHMVYPRTFITPTYVQYAKLRLAVWHAKAQVAIIKDNVRALVKTDEERLLV